MAVVGDGVVDAGVATATKEEQNQIMKTESSVTNRIGSRDYSCL